MSENKSELSLSGREVIVVGAFGAFPGLLGLALVLVSRLQEVEPPGIFIHTIFSALLLGAITVLGLVTSAVARWAGLRGRPWGACIAWNCLPFLLSTITGL